MTAFLHCGHIIPIALGWDEFDPNNLQTLCVVCHKEKTNKDMIEIADARCLERGVSTVTEREETILKKKE